GRGRAGRPHPERRRLPRQRRRGAGRARARGLAPRAPTTHRARRRTAMALADGTVGSELVKARDCRGDKPFLMFDDDVYTYADMEERSARVANGLRDLGVARGSNVAMIMPNSPEFLWAWFAASR